MNPDHIADKLRRIPDKVAFCRRHQVARRTLYRIIDGEANPTMRTLQAFADALKREARKTRAAA